MAAYLDLPAGNAALKEWYDDQKVENLAYDDNPWLVMVPKKANATGKYVPIPVVWEVNQGRSSNFGNAQGNQTPGLLAEFAIPLRPDYDIATLGNQAMLASQDDKGSFLDFATLFIDLAIQGAGNSSASSMYRAGTGSIGQISSITSGGVITLTSAADVSQFGVNQTLQSNQTDGGTPRAALGYVVFRNVAAGTITVSGTGIQGAPGQPSSWSANDFLVVQGDNNAKLSGLTAWLPSTPPTSSDNFYGVNRSPDTRLYGIYYNGQTQPIEEAVIDHLMLLRREKGRPKHYLTNYGTIAALLKALQARKEFVDFEGDAEISFRGVRIQGPAGPVDVFADRNAQAQTGFAVQMNTWKLFSLNAVPHIFRYGDQLEMLRLANADASEARVGSYSNLGCFAPGWSGQTALGA